MNVPPDGTFRVRLCNTCELIHFEVLEEGEVVLSFGMDDRCSRKLIADLQGLLYKKVASK